MEWDPSNNVFPENDINSEIETDINFSDQLITTEAGTKNKDIFEPEDNSEVIFLSENIFLPPLDSNKESPVLLEHKPETKNMVFTYLNNDEEEEIELQQKSSIATDMIEDI